MVTGLAVWLGSAYAFFNEITVSSTGMVLPCLYGTVAAALSPIPYSVIITLFKPQNFDWGDFAKQRLAFEKLDENFTTGDHRTLDISEDFEASTATKRQELKRWGRIAAFWSIATFFGHWVLWPLPMYASHYVFGRSVRFSFLDLQRPPHFFLICPFLSTVLLSLVGHCNHLALGHSDHRWLLSHHRWRIPTDYSRLSGLEDREERWSKRLGREPHPPVN